MSDRMFNIGKVVHGLQLRGRRLEANSAFLDDSCNRAGCSDLTGNTQALSIGISKEDQAAGQ